MADHITNLLAHVEAQADPGVRYLVGGRLIRADREDDGREYLDLLLDSGVRVRVAADQAVRVAP